MFVPDGNGSYAPVPTAAAWRWLSEAANNSSSFQRLTQEGQRPVPGGGAKNESYLPIEAGLFESKERVTLLVENASPGASSFAPSTLIEDRRPSIIETLVVSSLCNLDKAPAKIESQDPAGAISIPPFSLTRIVWEKSRK